jgi:hypothetical protein
MTITPLELIKLKAALQALDKFKFDSKTTYTLSRNLNWIESEIKAIDSTRKKLSEEFGNPKQDDTEFPNYVKKLEEVLEIPIEIKELRKIPYTSLNVGDGNEQNAISISVVNALFPLISEEPEPKKGNKK